MTAKLVAIPRRGGVDAHDVYYMLRDSVEFHDLGGQYFAQRDRDKERLTKRLLRRLRELGVEVEATLCKPESGQVKQVSVVASKAVWSRSFLAV